jgi:putative copper export protein
MALPVFVELPLHAASLVGLLLLGGALMTTAYVLPLSGALAVQPRIARFGGLGVVLLMLGTFGPVATGAARGWGGLVGPLLQLVGATVALSLLRRAVRGTPPSIEAAAGTLLLVSAGSSVTGHAAQSEVLRGAAIALDAVHGAAASAWIGGLALLVLAMIPALPGEAAAARDARLAALVRAFTPYALTAVVVLGLTGVVGSYLQFGLSYASFGSAYGRTLALKLVAVAATGALGLYNWKRVSPRLGDAEGTATLRRTAGGELVAAGVVVAITTVLTWMPVG